MTMNILFSPDFRIFFILSFSINSVKTFVAVHQIIAGLKIHTVYVMVNVKIRFRYKLTRFSCGNVIFILLNKLFASVKQFFSPKFLKDRIRRNRSRYIGLCRGWTRGVPRG